MSNLILKDGNTKAELLKPGTVGFVIKHYGFEHHKKCHCHKGFDDDYICFDCNGLGYKKEWRNIYHPERIEIKQVIIDSDIKYVCSDNETRYGSDIFLSVKDALEEIAWKEKHN